MLPLNFKAEFWYTPEPELESRVPARFLLQPLTYKQFSLLQLDLPNQQYEHPFHILTHCISDMENVCLPNPLEYTIDVYLPEEILKDLTRAIREAFFPTVDFVDRLNTNIDLLLDPRFSGESYDCTICQQRKLHFQRNCPFIPKEEHDPTYRVPFMGETVTVCPVGKRDNKLTEAIIESYKIFASDFLPEEGGLGDQTVFFVLASQRMESRLKYFEAKLAEERKNK